MFGVGDRKECFKLNPLEVHKIIKESRDNGERLIIEELSRRCGVRLRHAHLRFSKDMFECEACGGFPRHWVKGVSIYGWITLWRYVPPKETDFSPVAAGEKLKSFAELKDLNEVEPENIQVYPEKKTDVK